MLSPENLLVLSLIIILAFIIKGVTGFGENMVMIPLSLFILELEVVLPLTLMVVLVADGYLLYYFYSEIDWKAFNRFLFPAVLGIFLGTMGLQAIDENTLETILGVIVILYALYSLLRNNGQGVTTGSTALNSGAGLMGGILSGMLGIGGPPIIAYLNHIRLGKKAFRATCVITFLSFDLFRLGAYTWKGYFSFDTLMNGITLLPAFMIGTFIGVLIHNKLPENTFQKIIGLFLIIIGLILMA